MRKKIKTIKLAKIRRVLRVLCRRYHSLERLAYPKCFSRPQEELEKVAKKVYDIVKEENK